MVEHKKPIYSNESRGYKTKGNSYKDRYIKDKICPECGGHSIYKDETNSSISYKCLRRSCRYNWFESKTQKEELYCPDCDGTHIYTYYMGMHIYHDCLNRECKRTWMEDKQKV